MGTPPSFAFAQSNTRDIQDFRGLSAPRLRGVPSAFPARRSHPKRRSPSSPARAPKNVTNSPRGDEATRRGCPASPLLPGPSTTFSASSSTILRRAHPGSHAPTAEEDARTSTRQRSRLTYEVSAARGRPLPAGRTWPAANDGSRTALPSSARRTAAAPLPRRARVFADIDRTISGRHDAARQRPRHPRGLRFHFRVRPPSLTQKASPRVDFLSPAAARRTASSPPARPRAGREHGNAPSPRASTGRPWLEAARRRGDSLLAQPARRHGPAKFAAAASSGPTASSQDGDRNSRRRRRLHSLRAGECVGRVACSTSRFFASRESRSADDRPATTRRRGPRRHPRQRPRQSRSCIAQIRHTSSSSVKLTALQHDRSSRRRRDADAVGIDIGRDGALLRPLWAQGLTSSSTGRTCRGT